MRESSNSGEVALCEAAMEGRTEALTSLLQKGVCPNVFDVCDVREKM